MAICLSTKVIPWLLAWCTLLLLSHSISTDKLASCILQGLAHHDHSNETSIVLRVRLDTSTSLKIYQPSLFYQLRQHAGVSEPLYWDCLEVARLQSLSSDSKSGQAFWRSSDGHVILKTIKHYECKTLAKILKIYADHVLSDHSCLGNLLGLYRVKAAGRRATYFLAAKNIYTTMPSSKRFDLKGSTVGRRKAKSSSVWKDLDLLDTISSKSPLQQPLQPQQQQEEKDEDDLVSKQQGLHLGPSAKAILMHGLQRDVEFLSDLKLMDYSLLVEIEDWLAQEGERSHNVAHLAETCSNRGKLSLCGRGSQLYHFGIVDFLQRYTFRKWLEHWLKSLFYNRKCISCVEPKFYAKRMLAYIDRVIV
eukprot:gene8272-9121_t